MGGVAVVLGEGGGGGSLGGATAWNKLLGDDCAFGAIRCTLPYTCSIQMVTAYRVCCCFTA